MAQGATSESKLEVWAPRMGEVVAGRYRVLRVIGQGGMGAVVAAQHVQLEEPVAIKFLHPKLARDSASVERFFREAKATTRIKSEHVVRVLDVGQSESGIPFIVMELLEGADLGRVLAAGPLSISNAVDFLLQASEALAEAHAAGIVHRDLKPSNLWLAQRSDGSPLVKVLDFGISKLSAQAPGDAKLTETQSVFGSPMYMSPEQIRSAKKVDHRTDVWALGVVLQELLTGKLPFDADTVSGVLACIAADPPIPLRLVRPDAPAGLEAAILACLQKDVNRRCQSLAELAGLLAPFASPVGLLSANRIGRIGIPRNSMVPAAPSSISGDFSAASGATERSLSTAANISQQRRSPFLAVLLGVGIACVVVALGFGVFRITSTDARKAVAAPAASPGGSGLPVAVPASIVPSASSALPPSPPSQASGLVGTAAAPHVRGAPANKSPVLGPSTSATAVASVVSSSPSPSAPPAPVSPSSTIAPERK